MDTLVRETRIREEKQHQVSIFHFVQVANVHFGNVCMGSPVSALQHSCNLMFRT